MPINRRKFMAAGASAAAMVVGMQNTSAQQWQPSQRYPDPLVKAIDPSFGKYKLGLAKIEKIADGCRWSEGRVWFGDGRAAQVGVLDSYLTGLADAGRLTLPGPAPLVARTIVESCALWAVHCHFDPGAVLGGSGSGVDDGAAIVDPAVAAMLATLFTKATAYAGSALSPAT